MCNIVSETVILFLLSNCSFLVLFWWIVIWKCSAYFFWRRGGEGKCCDSCDVCVSLLISGNAGCGCKSGLAGDGPEHHQPGSDGGAGPVVKGFLSSYTAKHRTAPSPPFQVIALIFNVIISVSKKFLGERAQWSWELNLLSHLCEALLHH